MDHLETLHTASGPISVSEHAYRVFFHCLPEAACIINEQVIADVNEACLKMLGCSREDVIGRCFWEFIHPKDLGRITERRRKRIMGEALDPVAEFTALRSDGSTFDVESSLVSLPLGDDGMWVAVLRDVTERKRGFEALQQSEERLRSFIENISDMVTVADNHGVIIFQSPATEKVLGYTPDEMIGTSAFQYIHPDDVQSIVSAFNKAIMRDRGIPPLEFRCRHKDGTWRFLRATGNSLPDRSGSTGLIINSLDITDRKLTEEHTAVINRCRLGWGINYQENVDSIVAAAGETLGAACALYNRLEGERLQTVSIWGEPAGFSQVDMADGHVVHAGGQPVGSLCVVFKNKRKLSHSELHFLTDLTAALGNEEERHSAEESLRESEERYRLLAENAVDVMWQTDLNGIFTYISPAIRWLGYEPTEWIGHHVSELLPLHEQEVVNSALSQDLLDLRHKQYELQTLRKDGSLIWMDVSINFVVEDGVPVKIQGISRDITERKKAENALRLSEERFRIAAECASELIYECDFVGTHTEWYGDIDGKLGYAPGEFPRTAEAFNDMIHPDDKVWSSEEFREHEKSGEPFFLEYRLILRDGSIRYWTDRGLVLLNESGKPYKCIGVTSDVTERKEAEEALKVSEAKFRSYIDQSIDGIFIIDSLGNFIDVNPAGCNITGYNRDELLNMYNRVLIASGIENENAATEQYCTLIHTGRSKGEVIIQKKDGSTVVVEIHAVALGQDRYMGVVRDVTERKQSEQTVLQSLAALEKAYALQSEFVRNMTHEVRTPLTGVIGYAQALLEGVTGNVSEEQRRVLKRIVEQAESLLCIVEEVLESATLAAGVQKLDLRTLRIESVLQDVVNLLEKTAREKGISISSKASSRLPVVVSDAQKLTRIITNLVSNAVKFTFKGSVSVSAQRSGDGVDIVIQDTGTGIPEDRQDQVFDAFVQMSYPGKHKPVGAGLGLSIVSDLVDVLGCSLVLSSVSGEGTAFTLHIPLQHGEMQ